MSENNLIKQRIIDTFQEMKDYTEIIVKVNGDRDGRLAKIKETYEKNKNAEEVKQFAFDIFFMSSFQNLDLQIIKTKFVSYMDLYLLENGEDTLDAEMVNSYKYLKSQLPKRMFLVKSGELKEIEEGSIEAKKQQYKKENLFNIVEQQLKAVLNVREDK